MNTELPRATETLNLAQVRSDALDLQSMKAEFLNNLKNQPAINRYLEENPAPDHGFRIADYASYSDYRAAVLAFENSNSEWQEWDSKRREFVISVVRGNGFAEDIAYDDWAEGINVFYTRFNELLQPRASKYSCWGEEIEGICIAPFFYELASKGLEDFPPERIDEVFDIAEKAVAESVSMLLERIGPLEKSAKEVATLACNANGLYE